MRLKVVDPQIVNGLQTSREIFDYFSDEDAALEREEESRSVLVRVIQTSDTDIMDGVIRATNSQNRMQEASLRMTDPIHRKIEDLLKPYGILYDRRKGYYKDQGAPINAIISPTLLAQAVIAILLQRPDDARGRPGNYFRDDAKYELIFGEEKLPLPVYLSCIRIMARVQRFLYTSLDTMADYKNLQFYVGALVASELTQQLDPSPELLLEKTDPQKITSDFIRPSFRRVFRIYESLSKTIDRDTVARGPELLKKLRRQTKRRFSLSEDASDDE